MVASVSEVSWVLGKAGTRGVGIAVEVLGTLVNSMTNLNLSNGFGSKGHKISILAFEIANTIIKGANIMQSLSKKNVINLKQVVLPSEGVQHLVSKDMDELLRIASADKREELKLFSGEVVRFGNLCIDPQWHNLDRYFEKLGAELTPHRQLKEEADTVIEQLTALAQYTAGKKPESEDSLPPSKKSKRPESEEEEDEIPLVIKKKSLQQKLGLSTKKCDLPPLGTVGQSSKQKFLIKQKFKSPSIRTTQKKADTSSILGILKNFRAGVKEPRSSNKLKDIAKGIALESSIEKPMIVEDNSSGGDPTESFDSSASDYDNALSSDEGLEEDIVEAFNDRFTSGEPFDEEIVVERSIDRKLFEEEPVEEESFRTESVVEEVSLRTESVETLAPPMQEIAFITPSAFTEDFSVAIGSSSEQIAPEEVVSNAGMNTDKSTSLEENVSMEPSAHSSEILEKEDLNLRNIEAMGITTSFPGVYKIVLIS
ncbi:hypothetical protein HHK36_030347 [Tetracentron sinense]|uniref:DUF3475 domain-containing protein n=1 Tax=Tetracentron sinense TaxID=13715 RepID=A0A835CYM5_TETSI|nr:hypothetical protein HHK36_030347 [Tetracentron sinense]